MGFKRVIFFYLVINTLSSIEVSPVVQNKIISNNNFFKTDYNQLAKEIYYFNNIMIYYINFLIIIFFCDMFLIQNISFLKRLDLDKRTDDETAFVIIFFIINIIIMTILCIIFGSRNICKTLKINYSPFNWVLFLVCILLSMPLSFFAHKYNDIFLFFLGLIIFFAYLSLLYYMNNNKIKHLSNQLMKNPQLIKDLQNNYKKDNWKIIIKWNKNLNEYEIFQELTELLYFDGYKKQYQIYYKPYKNM